LSYSIIIDHLVLSIDEVSIAYISLRAIIRGLLTHIDEGNKKKPGSESLISIYRSEKTA